MLPDTNTSSLQSIETRIFMIRGVAVMLDSDLADVYRVSTKTLNQAVKRNLYRFPEMFLFTLYEEEWKSLRSQIVTLKSKRGQHRKYLPYVFTEKGVAMLSAVLNSDVAVKVSVRIIDAFVQFRKSGLTIAEMNQRIEYLEIKQIDTDKNFQNIFNALEKANPSPQQGIFYNGQIFDAYLFAAERIKSANHSIILIDNYIDETTLALLSKRKTGVTIIIYSQKSNAVLEKDVQKWNLQFDSIQFRLLKNNSTDS
jgi:phage regulator Rha-like protein